MSYDWAAVLESYHTFVETFAIIVAAYIAYLKYVKGRLYKIRIAPEVTCKVIQGGNADQLCIAAQITNVGALAAPIPPKGFFVVVLEPNSVEASLVTEVQWKIVNAFNVFAKQNVIEVGEVTRQEILVSVPKGKYTNLRLVLLCWTNSKRHPLAEKYAVLRKIHDKLNPFYDHGSRIETSLIVPL